MKRIILHLDMDAFYASIEQRDQPALRGKPVIVGGSPQERGVVCAASYEARKFGVRSAIPSSVARRLCPGGIFIRPRMSHYKSVSGQVMGILQETGARLEPVSIDEAYLELTDRFGADCSGATLDELLLLAVPRGSELKARIRRECGLTASIGIASNKLLAKIASDFQKPDGLTLIPERDKKVFLRPLPVRLIHGVGPVTEKALNTVGIRTIGDLQDYAGDLKQHAGSFGPKLKQYAFGEDDRPVEVTDEVKSISSEETFSRDTEDRSILRECLRQQSGEIEAKLREHELGAHTVQVKVRYGDFTTLTRQISLEEPVTQRSDIYRLACFLLRRDKLVCRPLRLLGLGVSGLGEPIYRQLKLL